MSSVERAGGGERNPRVAANKKGKCLVPRKQSEGEFYLRKHLRMGLPLCRNVKCKDALQRSNRKSAGIHEETSTREIHQWSS